MRQEEWCLNTGVAGNKISYNKWANVQCIIWNLYEILTQIAQYGNWAG